jgi:hypothetical protein
MMMMMMMMMVMIMMMNVICNKVYVGSWDGQIKQLDLRQKAWVRVLKCEQAGGGDSPIRCLAVATAPTKSTGH